MGTKLSSAPARITAEPMLIALRGWSTGDVIALH